MPQIELRNAWGYSKRIDSSNPELLASWLWEQVSQNSMGNVADPALQILMRPSEVDRTVQGEPIWDWTPDSRLLGPWFVNMRELDTPYKRALALIAAFTDLADQFKDPD